ncbi:adipose-secreted signaling protein isoform X1 [Bos taurus]|uniref:adipose-secreted signaling protein isoform X1 n=1 Tax=Bos taurus TaxID=9913 RepID=UPI0028CB4CB8|nr:adipose-secreted signaling protein isoform X1 [Bos taurus]
MGGGRGVPRRRAAAARGSLMFGVGPRLLPRSPELPPQPLPPLRSSLTVAASGCSPHATGPSVALTLALPSALPTHQAPAGVPGAWEATERDWWCPAGAACVSLWQGGRPWLQPTRATSPESGVSASQQAMMQKAPRVMSTLMRSCMTLWSWSPRRATAAFWSSAQAEQGRPRDTCPQPAPQAPQRHAHPRRLQRQV